MKYASENYDCLFVHVQRSETSIDSDAFVRKYYT